MSNGCGCSNGPLRYVRLPYARRFYVPCVMHDDDYDRGGDGFARLVADRELYRHIVRAVWLQESNPWRITWLTLVAMGYYAGVRLLGWHYYNYRKHG